jgi:hypothetical protein
MRPGSFFSVASNCSKAWQESIDSNIAAAAAAEREGQTAEELHSSDYEIYA